MQNREAQSQCGNDGRVVEECSTTEDKTTSRPPNPISQASLLSWLTFTWPYSIMKVGLERTIEEADLPEVEESESSSYNLALMQRLWDEEVANASKARRRPSLHRALVRYYYSKLWFVLPLIAIASAAHIGQGLALGLLIEYIGKPEEQGWDGWVWASVLVLCGIIILFEHHHVYFNTWRMGMRLRIASIASIYDKSLKLRSTGGLEVASSGKVMNLASNDVERFILASIFISYLLIGPIEAVVILIVGIFIVGPAFAAGYVLLFIFIPLQLYLSHKFAKFRSKIAAITDERVTLVSQAVSGARVVKMSGWEEQFRDRIAKIRCLEMKKIQSANRLKSWNEAIYFASNVTVSIVIFAVHVATGGALSSRTVFSTVTLINIVQLTMTKYFSLAVMGVSECYVSVARIQEFLDFPELRTPFGPDSKVCKQTRSSLSLNDVTCYWNDVTNAAEKGEQNSSPSNSSIPEELTVPLTLALDCITLDFRLGNLHCIIGAVGCGKSALIQAVAGELPPAKGSINLNGLSLAYASQDPWIMNGSVRENITMGRPLHKKWYGQVVSACGLNIDFEQFRNGDATIVGDRGVQCSGGQRARIGLARALYRDADILLLDDPLSAVDSKVGRLIYYSAIQDLGVKRGKCVVLATHQHQFIGDADCILIEKGKVVCTGPYVTCVQASNGTLREAFQTYGKSQQESGISEDFPTQLETNKELEANEPTEEPMHVPTSKGEGLDQKEIRNTGVVKLSTWLEYASAMGGTLVSISLLVLFAVAQGSVLVSIIFIGNWAKQPVEEQGSPYYFGLDLGLCGVVIILSIVRAVTTFFCTIKASQRLHDRMAESVLRARIEFFDTNPLGRILNRFSADVGSNDDLLPTTLYDFLMCAFMVLGGIATAVSVLPFTLLVLPLLGWYFVRVRRVFITTSRELKRVEGMTRSPIFAILSESLSGIATIRTNDAIVFYQQKFREAQNAHSRAFFAFMASSRWLGFRMDSLMFLLMTMACYLAVLFHEQAWFDVDPAVLGLALTMLLQLAGTFQWTVRQSAEVVNQMVSVERVSDFCHLPPEAPLVTRKDEELETWPRSGSIEVANLKVRYRSSLPLSLSGVSFAIQSGHRVGIVGRTGSGKSTLVQALFRLLEAEGGAILVDGVDISTLGLHKLRTKMSVIPQTPVLFSGCTIRENLDPFGKYDEGVIRRALEDVQMMKAIDDLPDGLDSVVSEGGSNFSVGQRQLICLARAILRKNKILVLDEPTANVDSRTDELLQQAVGKSFSGATVIAVAHRLDTVIDYDRILVLGKGEVLEYGSPRELLLKKDGNFASMVENTGAQMAGNLRRKAIEVA